VTPRRPGVWWPGCRADAPLLWKLFDGAEQAVAPRLEGLVRTAGFARALGLAARSQAAVRHGLEARSRRLWHLVNLPAGSDVAHLRRQIALLDRELREVRRALERAEARQSSKEEDDGPTPGPAGASRTRRAAGPRATGRRAQRPPRA
jgi:hypothetical protein